HNLELFESFLETVKDDYKNGGPQLRASLEKLAERYNPDNDPLVRVKSGAKIRVQVESIKHRKNEP
ncbi:7101_t:CDS:2, partial [Dentiscutata heterogama]